MVDPKMIARNIGVDDKALMMQMLTEMRAEIKQLSATISEQIGIKKETASKNNQTIDTLSKSIKNSSEKSVEQLTKEIVENFKRERQKEREETQAQLKASFAILGERFNTLSKSVRTTASATLNTFTKPNDKSKDPTDAARDVARGAFSGAAKMLAPEKIKKPNVGQVNPEFDKTYASIEDDVKAAAAKDADMQKKLVKMVAALKKQQALGGMKTDMFNDLIKELETAQAPVEDNKSAVKKLAKKKKDEYIEKSNNEKKEALAEWQAEKDKFKEKNSTASKAGRSLISDTLQMFTKQNDKPQDATDAYRDMFRKSTNYVTKKVQPWLGEGNKDKGQVNPGFEPMKSVGSDSLSKEIRNDTKEILKRLDEADDKEAMQDRKEENRLGLLSKSVKKIDRENDDESEEITNVKSGISKLNRYIRNNLVDDIVKELGGNQQGTQKNQAQPAEHEGEHKEGAEEGEGGGLGKWGSRLKKGWQTGKNVLGKIGRVAKGGGRLAMQGGRLALQGARFLGSGSAAGGLAVGALAAASAYTAYETYKTAKTITGNKSDVRESTKGTAEAVTKQNEASLNKDSPDVKAGAQRYTKAGMGQDEASATSLAERENSRMTTTAASMGGIFSAAKNSTDFRTSDEEMQKLTEGEMLAGTIRSGLDGLGKRLQDPNAVKNMSPEEAKNVARQAKVTLKQIQDLSKTWEDSKKSAKGTFMNSQWLNDKNLVSNGDNVVKSLLKSGKEIESAFDAWSDIIGEGAKKRKDLKSKDKPKADQKIESSKADAAKQSSPPPAAEAAPDAASTAESRFNDLDDALATHKPIKPPAGYREKTPADDLKKSISSVTDNSKPAISKMAVDLKDSMGENHKKLSEKLDELNTKLDVLGKKKPPAAPVQTVVPPDQSFGSIQTIAKGYDS
jgi:hypothetical protein